MGGLVDEFPEEYRDSVEDGVYHVLAKLPAVFCRVAQCSVGGHFVKAVWHHDAGGVFGAGISQRALFHLAGFQPVQADHLGGQDHCLAHFDFTGVAGEMAVGKVFDQVNDHGGDAGDCDVYVVVVFEFAGDGLEGGVVSSVAVDEQKFVNAVVTQALQHVLYHGCQCARAQGQGAGKSEMVLRLAEGDGRAEQHFRVESFGQPPGDFVGTDGVGAHFEVRAMLLAASDCQEGYFDRLECLGHFGPRHAIES